MRWFNTPVIKELQWDASSEVLFKALAGIIITCCYDYSACSRGVSYQELTDLVHLDAVLS